MVHAFRNHNGRLCSLVFADAHYPAFAAFRVAAHVLQNFQHTPSSSSFNLDDELMRSQKAPLLLVGDDADQVLAQVQQDLDGTIHLLHETIHGVLARGEKLDSLVEKSADLSQASRYFYKQAQRHNSCCSLS